MIIITIDEDVYRCSPVPGKRTIVVLAAQLYSPQLELTLSAAEINIVNVIL
jgi:mRNA-degrading endonuclease toxin of MazEF toxin-antitoxin module